MECSDSRPEGDYEGVEATTSKVIWLPRIVQGVEDVVLTPKYAYIMS